MSFTFLHEQVCVELQVIEPSWDLDPAAVHTGITPLSVQDGQRHVSARHPAPELEPGGLHGQHNPIRGEDGSGALGIGHHALPPTETQDAVSLGVIPTGQSHIVPNEASDFNGAGRHCGGQQRINLDDTMQIAFVINKCEACDCIHTCKHTHSITLTPTGRLEIQENSKARVSTHLGS